MLLLMNWLTLNCVFQQKLTLDSIQNGYSTGALIGAARDSVTTDASANLSCCLQLLYYPGWPVAHWLLVQEMALLGPMLHSIKAANPVHILETLLEMEVLTSTEPVTPHTQLIVMPWVMGTEGQRLYVHRGFLIKMETIFTDKAKPGPSATIHLWGSGPPILICIQVQWHQRRSLLFRATNHLGSPQESTERDPGCRFIHLTDGVGDDLPREPLLSILTWTSLIKGPIDRSVS